YPLCDGRHTQVGWSCTTKAIPRSQYVSVSSNHYRSLAQKWSAQHNALVMEEEEEPQIICQALWVFCDGSDIESILFHKKRVRAQQVILVSISISHQLLFALGSFDSVIEIQDESQKSLWVQLQNANLQSPQQRSPQRIFLSHAVVDEAQWIPALDEIRTSLGHSIFSCSDSITSGSNWYTEIIRELVECDWVLCLISKGFVRSTFCAFEVGMARALEKPMFLISIDDSFPPSYAQELHMETLSRYCATRPWLTQKEALSEAVLTFASTYSTEAP
ncbi:MAG: hypothetical protein CL916_09880, partial [Deltaproteobacteria bacterium]|nr:hypothetical protein [Deltaproteobacteria bacterium]